MNAAERVGSALALAMTLAGCAEQAKPTAVAVPPPPAPAPAAPAPVQPAPAPAPTFASLLPGGTGRWDLVWNEEFDGAAAELDRRWKSQNGPSGHILSSRWRENAVVSNGTLRLVNRKEKRGGQEWTSGSIWTHETFQYGYFECRYRYAAAEGCNNSFWLMPTTKVPAGKKHFEIDINEGHFPNEINSNIHNHSDRIEVNGRKTHPTASRSISFGLRPDVTIQLENPVATRRIRFSTRQPGAVHLGEFRIFNVRPAGYPAALSTTSDLPGLVNFARAPTTKITVSGCVQTNQNTAKLLVDGQAETRWVSQREGDKWAEFTFAATQTVGCLQFISGYGKSNDWKSLLSDYRVEYHDGARWVQMADFDVAKGNFNLSRDFHVYGLEWTEQELVFYFNGQELRREKNVFCHSPAPVWLSLAIIAWAGPVTDAIDGTAMEVDYVRIFRGRE